MKKILMILILFLCGFFCSCDRIDGRVNSSYQHHLCDYGKEIQYQNSSFILRNNTLNERFELMVKKSSLEEEDIYLAFSIDGYSDNNAFYWGFTDFKSIPDDAKKLNIEKIKLDDNWVDFSLKTTMIEFKDTSTIYFSYSNETEEIKEVLKGYSNESNCFNFDVYNSSNNWTFL